MLVKYIIAGIVAVSLWVAPVPAGLSVDGMHFFIIFSMVILSTISNTFSITESVLYGLTFSIFTGFLDMPQALAGYSSPITWLVVTAFLIANTVVKTGLGRRVALQLVHGLGHSTLGLGYAICVAECLFATIIPSNVARGGGLMAPIVFSMAEVLGSKPHQYPRKIGNFLVLIGAHANNISSAMFLTAMVANSVIVGLAADIYAVEFDWTMWFVGASVPGVLSLIVAPILIHRVTRPTITSLEPLRSHLRDELQALGPMTWQEIGTGGVLGGLLIGWATKPWHGYHPAAIAFLGLVVILLMRIMTWRAIANDIRAWENFLWLGGIMTLGNRLKESGFIDWLAMHLKDLVVDLDPVLALCIIWVFYLYSMYGFASETTHVSTLLGSVMLITKLIKAPPLLAVASLAYASSLCACLTNYASGTAVIYFGSRYVASSVWFRAGFLMSCSHIIIWLGGGLLWWKLLGWY